MIARRVGKEKMKKVDVVQVLQGIVGWEAGYGLLVGRGEMGKKGD